MSSKTAAVSSIGNKRAESAKLWNAYLKNPTARTHEALWQSYQPLVCHIAERFNEKLGGSFELAALTGAGNVGLLDALAEYNASTTALFESVAVPMIRRAMARSLAVQRSKEKSHGLRFELADAITLTSHKSMPELPVKVALVALGSRLRLAAK